MISGNQYVNYQRIVQYHTSSNPKIDPKVASWLINGLPLYISLCLSGAGLEGTMSVILLFSPVMVRDGEIDSKVSLLGTSTEGETTWTRIESLLDVDDAPFGEESITET